MKSMTSSVHPVIYQDSTLESGSPNYPSLSAGQHHWTTFRMLNSTGW